MKTNDAADKASDWEGFLAELGAEFGATIQLAEVIGRRWSHVAGRTDSDAGLLGVFREDLGDGHGAIIFPHQRDFPLASREAIRRRLTRRLQTFAVPRLGSSPSLPKG